MKTELPPMTATGKRRLRKLIGFLRQLPPEKFDFASVVEEYEKNGHICGTVCCAIGWTPSIFPRIVEWTWCEEWEEANVRNKEGKQVGYQEVAHELFEISGSTARYLFAPGYQKLVHVTLPKVGELATPKRVAAMLEKYITLTETPAK